jgi:3-hydroxybutyryl-CoA dehydrogenase
MIKKIGVVGAGTMGHGIAESFAMYGYEVNLYDTDANRLISAKKEIKEELELLAEEKFIESRTVQQIFGNITFNSDLRETVKERD